MELVRSYHTLRPQSLRFVLFAPLKFEITRTGHYLTPPQHTHTHTHTKACFFSYKCIYNMLHYSSSNTTCSSLYFTTQCLLYCTLVKSTDLTNSVKTVRQLSISSLFVGGQIHPLVVMCLSWCFCGVPVYCVHKLRVPQSVLPHCRGTSGLLLF